MNSKKRVAILYNNDSNGAFTSSPKWHFDPSFPTRNILAKQLAEHDIEFSIIRFTFPQADQPLSIVHATEPVFEDDGSLNLEKTVFTPTDLSEAADIIIDELRLPRVKKYGISLPSDNTLLLNHSSIHDLGTKLRSYQDVLRPLGLGIATYDLHELDADNLSSQLTNIDGGVFVKPADGRLSLGIHYFDTPQQFRDKLPELQDELTVPYVAQPEYAFMAKWPDIHPFSEQDHDKLLESNVDGVRKELRIYCFYDAQAQPVAQCFPIGRIAKKGERLMYACDRFFVDPNRCPPELEPTVVAIAERMALLSEQRAFIITVDFCYGAMPGDSNLKWEVMEINSYCPYLGFVTQHDEIGAHVQSLQLEHLVRLVR